MSTEATLPLRRTSTLTLRRYIYYSTLIGVFSAALIYRTPAFTIHFFYFIAISNLILLIFIGNTLQIPRWIGWMMLYLLLSGIVGVFRGTDTPGQLLKEFLGITVNALFYYYFFRFYRNDYMRAFVTYARISYWVCLLGFPILILESLQVGQLVKLHSVASEPAAFCELILPAYYWYAYMFLTHRKHGRELLVFLLAIALSVSALGYLSVAFGIFLLPFRRKAWLVATPIMACSLLAIAYSISVDFKTRVNDTVQAIAAANVQGSNPSTFALVSNMLVTREVFSESPLIGNGLGSHVVSYERMIGDVQGIELVPESWNGLNSQDAASLTLRLLSEQGVLGLCLVLWFIVKFHAGWKGQHAAISNALLTAFFLKLIRGGIYFGPEQFFFVFIYLLNYRQFRLEKKVSRHLPTSRVLRLAGNPSI